MAIAVMRVALEEMKLVVTIDTLAIIRFLTLHKKFLVGRRLRKIFRCCFCFPQKQSVCDEGAGSVKISWDLAQIVMDNQDGLAFLSRFGVSAQMMFSLTESIPKAKAHPRR